MPDTAAAPRAGAPSAGAPRAGAPSARRPKVGKTFRASGEGTNQDLALKHFNETDALEAPTFVIVKLTKSFASGDDYNAVWVIPGKSVPMHQLESSYISMAKGSPVLLADGSVKVRDKSKPSEWHAVDVVVERLDARQKRRLVDYDRFALMTINVDGKSKRWTATLSLLNEPLRAKGAFLLFD